MQQSSRHTLTISRLGALLSILWAAFVMAVVGLVVSIPAVKPLTCVSLGVAWLLASVIYLHALQSRQ
jgi:ABC-type enterochelin transport system permease subunit